MNWNLVDDCSGTNRRTFWCRNCGSKRDNLKGRENHTDSSKSHRSCTGKGEKTAGGRNAHYVGNPERIRGCWRHLRVPKTYPVPHRIFQPREACSFPRPHSQHTGEQACRLRHCFPNRNIRVVLVRSSCHVICPDTQCERVRTCWTLSAASTIHQLFKCQTKSSALYLTAVEVRARHKYCEHENATERGERHAWYSRTQFSWQGCRFVSNFPLRTPKRTTITSL